MGWRVGGLEVEMCLLMEIREGSLEKEPGRRATPWRMLEHPWMVEMKGKKVSMEKFLQQVWDWKD